MMRKRYAILLAVMVASIMGPIDASIMNINYHIIGGYFGTDLSTAQWLISIYLLTISSLLLFFGRLGDISGYKRIYTTGLLGFTITSGLCTLSYFFNSIYILILLRAIQGVTAAMMMSVPHAIITSAFPSSERGRALGINAISISLGLAIGPSLGGFIANSFGWQFIFLINVPIGILGIILAQRVIPEIKGEGGRIDIPGALFAFLFLFSSLFLINRFRDFTMNTRTIALITIAFLSILAFLRQERRTPTPILNLSLFQNINFSLANVSALFNFMAQYFIVTLLPSYLGRILNLPQNRVGLIMTSFPLAVLIIAPFAGILSDRIGTKFLAAGGAFLCAFGLSLMATLSPSSSLTSIILRLIIFGIGTGVFQSPNMSLAMGSVPRVHMGTASGIIATVRNLGMVLGIAIGGMLISLFVPSHILSGSSAILGENKRLFTSGLSQTFMRAAVLAGISGIISLLQKSPHRNHTL